MSTWTPPSARERLRFIQEAKTVAIVGASNNPARASYFVGTYLLSTSNLTIWFVNPREETVLNHPAYATLADLPSTPDIVDVFRKPSDIPAVLTEALDVGARTFWMQLGIENLEAAQLGHDAGMNVVTNRCLKIEHARFHGGLHLAGFNTGVISSRKSVV